MYGGLKQFKSSQPSSNKRRTLAQHIDYSINYLQRGVHVILCEPRADLLEFCECFLELQYI